MRRRAFVLERRQWLPLALDRTFAFFADPGNLPRITPPWLGFRILTPPPLTMAEGLRIDYRVRVLGVPVRWRSQIAVYDPPRAFCDVQVIGPYRRWEHTHRFLARDGGTLVEDRVVYEPPLGPLAGLVDALLIRRQLRRIFDHRRERIAMLLVGEDAREIAAGARAQRSVASPEAGQRRS